MTSNYALITSICFPRVPPLQRRRISPVNTTFLLQIYYLSFKPTVETSNNQRNPVFEAAAPRRLRAALSVQFSLACCCRFFRGRARNCPFAVAARPSRDDSRYAAAFDTINQRQRSRNKSVPGVNCGREGARLSPGRRVPKHAGTVPVTVNQRAGEIEV